MDEFQRAVKQVIYESFVASMDSLQFTSINSMSGNDDHIFVKTPDGRRYKISVSREP